MKKIYYTPKSLRAYLDKHRLDFLIKNPPYDVSKSNK
jgi:hypothetical protein